MKRSYYSALLALPLLLPAVVSVVPFAQATPAKPTIAQPQKISLNFKAPRRGAPTITAGGATRGSCQTGTKMLTPLVPKDQVGLTFSARPSFFLYIPSSETKTIDFLLLTGDGTEVIYQKVFTLAGSSGVVRFDLPTDAPALQTGKQYYWYFTLNCDPAKGPSGNPGVEGMIERVTPDAAIAKQLATAKPGDRPSIYAESGIWYETLTSLADLRQKTPADSKLMDDWKTLLQSVGLEAVATEPLVGKMANSR
jgi:hypothetical protein